MTRYILLIALFSLLCLQPPPAAAERQALSITGAVEQELALSQADLACLQSVTVQGNGVLQSGDFRGVFTYRGVPLHHLLRMAGIRKTEATFNKPVDLAVLATSTQGEHVALSWGEIFFQTQSPVIVALSAKPVLPKKDCSSCHKPSTFEPRLQQYERAIGFPKLVIPSDTYADRALEDLASLRLVQPEAPQSDREAELHADTFTIAGNVAQRKTIKDLSHLGRRTVRALHLGEGRGYHGLDTFSGFLLRQALEPARPKADIGSVFLVRAPDGYQALFSYGEVFLRSPGQRLLLADRVNGKDLEKGGEYFLISPQDKMADRWVKAVQSIEVLSLPDVVR
jgi:DMSO/TMAO reductase YedYZ molybdopterin-dependent catalytic subunit